MHLVEIFLPLVRGDGSHVPQSEIDDLTYRLADAFGGATAFTRSPADGLWHNSGSVEEDTIVVVEVMVARLDREWWRNLREELETRFQQEKILMRAIDCQEL